MLDKWFQKDIDAILHEKQIAVLVDESGECSFLLDSLPEKVQVYTCQDELEELHVKYQIEKAGPTAGKSLIYTNTPLEKLRYIREYCETNGKIQIKYLQNYIKDKVHRHLGLNLNLQEDEVVSAGKISLGKDHTYWMDLCHRGTETLFDLEKELIAFVHDPDTYFQAFDEKVQRVFAEKVHKVIDEPYSLKPAKTLAREVVDAIFRGLLQNNLSPLLEKVYLGWLDSVTYRSSFEGYLADFKPSAVEDLWAVHPAHPFIQIDRRQLGEMVSKLDEKEYVKKKVPWIRKRSRNPIAKQIKVGWWPAVLTFLDYNARQLSKISSFADCLEVYRADFYKVDRAMRVLYTFFLEDEAILRPLQRYYQDHFLAVYLDKWFRYFPKGYAGEQTGIISKIIREQTGKTAIIVGDGISYEYALEVKEEVSKTYRFRKTGPDYLLADYPTETEHNMSRIYMESGEIKKVHNQREKYLRETHPDKDIGFLELEKVNASVDQHQYLICSFKDLDELGEKQQLRALKYFAEMKATLARKIEQLLRNGYQSVFLISDHGFVLTGLLEESDKIIAQVSGKSHVSERYIRSEEDPGAAELITFEQEYGPYRYVSFSKDISPFKSPGRYGYGHGGLAPQEIITPYFCWELEASTPQLRVGITNKSDLKEVLGNLFSITLEGEGQAEDLFQAKRRVQIVLFSNGKEILRSDIISLENGQRMKKEFSFDDRDQLDLRVIDAVSKEKLDSATITKNKGRDLGGLL